MKDASKQRQSCWHQQGLRISFCLAVTYIFLVTFGGLLITNHIQNKITGNKHLLTTFWNDESISYWANINPIPPPPHSASNKTLKNYRRKLFLRQIASLQTEKCVPKSGIFKVEDLILEKKEKWHKKKKDTTKKEQKSDRNQYHQLKERRQQQQQQQQQQQLLSLLVSHQKVILYRCFPDRSYCEVDGTKCKPTKRKKTLIPIVFKLNDTVNDISEQDLIDGKFSETEYVVLNIFIEEHVNCSCQC